MSILNDFFKASKKRDHTISALRVEEPPEPLLSVKEAVSGSLVSVDAVEKEHIHLARRKAVLGWIKYDTSSNEAKDLVSVAKQAGLTLMVTSVLAKLKYVAAISSDSAILRDDHPVQNLWSERIWYNGDLPDFAIERVEFGQKLKLPFITIHSNERMPVRMEPMADPVIIGWLSNPGIKLSSSGEINRWVGGIYGFVLAMWDMDKEIQI